MTRRARGHTEGARLDRYELFCKLGEGGMAAVWLARLSGKRGFEQLVAIKTIKAHLVYDLRFEQMFLDEARIASRIRHPNVAQILDLGEEEGVLYLVMEWVDGESLARMRRVVQKSGKSVPLSIALRILADAAAGLHAAHELKDDAGGNLGVIHRDVSPQNILVAMSGAVKVIDFGIAKAKNRAAAETTDGLIKGKVAYMSPEQASGLPLDRRADVWALGVCLYELITGELPFDGESQQEILRLLIAKPDPPAFPADMPDVVRAVLTQALSADPDKRFLTAAAFERAVEGALTTLDAVATSDDVATFIREACPSAALMRRDLLATVERATGPVTKDVTPPREAEVTAPLVVQEVQRTTLPMDPPSTPTLTPASTTAPAAVPPRTSRTAIAIVLGIAVMGIVYAGLTLRRPTPITTTAVAAPVSVPSVAAASVSASAAGPAPVPTTLAVEPTSSPSIAKPRVVVPRAKGSAAPAAPKRAPVGYDSDGIPIAPQGKP